MKLFFVLPSTTLLWLTLYTAIQAQNLPCGVANPILDLPWLHQMAQYSCDPCMGPIYQAQYNGQYVFFNQPIEPTPCADAMISVMTCDGNQLCFFGGIAGGFGQGCPQFFESLTDLQQLTLINGQGCCNAPAATISLPNHVVCISGGGLPPIYTATVTMPVLSPEYAWVVFVAEALSGTIVIPPTTNLTLDFSTLAAGTYNAYVMTYEIANPPNLAATVTYELLNVGTCLNTSNPSPENELIIGTQIPYLTVTNEPTCKPDGSYTVGFTAYGSPNYINVSTNGIPNNFTTYEGQETIVTYLEPQYFAFPSDALTGCANDFIELMGPVNCTTACIDPSLIGSHPFCPLIYNPVCGCDGITYDNDCLAENAGNTSWTQGVCTACIDPTLIDTTMFCPAIWQPVCGCNGITYSNSCEATNYGGVTSWTPGECGGTACVDTSLIDLTVACPDLWQPVCGCNGITYSNSCDAINYGGVTSWIPGECGVTTTYNICQGDSLLIGLGGWEGNTTYSWSPSEGLSCSIGCYQTWASPSDTTLYVLTTFTTIGMTTAYYYYYVTVENCDTTGSNVIVPIRPNIQLQPNPATDQITVLYGNTQVLAIKVYNVLGQTVWTTTTPATDKTVLDLSSWQRGMYYLQVSTDKGINVAPFVKQ